MFNAIKYTQELEKAGFSHDQAEVSMKVLIEVMNDNFATRSDIKELDVKMDGAFERLHLKIDTAVERLGTKINAVAEKLDSKIQKIEFSVKELEHRLVVRLGTLMTVLIATAIGVLSAVVRFSH